MWINDKQKMDDEKESIAAKYAMQTKKVKVDPPDQPPTSTSFLVPLW